MEPLQQNSGSIGLLHVEHEPGLRDGIGRSLSARYPALSVHSAENGAQGLELFRQHRPDVVITDISMPVMNGIRMAAEIREIDHHTVIIALTAHSETGYLLDAIRTGISHYILKPVDNDLLFAMIDRLIQETLMKTESIKQKDRILKLERALEEEIAGRKKVEGEAEILRNDLHTQTSGLVAANKELEAFSYSVTHDLRKPLTIINGYCQVIKELCSGSLDEQCAEYLDKVYSGTLQMNELIDALLKLSLLGRGELHREMVDLSEMAKTVAAELKITEPGRPVAFRIAEGVVVKGDAGLLRVVLDNLMGNAWKYTAQKQEAVIEFGVAEYEGKGCCFVRDNGSGFDMADADKIFLPFQRLTAEAKGHGIGLATVQRIIQRHGGRVWAEGKRGEGATFYFHL